MTQPMSALLYVVNAQNQLLWYEHTGAGDGTDQWHTSPLPQGAVGSGWNVVKAVSGGNGVIYTVDAQGLLHWYRHDSCADGLAKWTYSPDPKGHIGEGWNQPHVVSGGNGILYTVDQDGHLRWFRHDGYLDGTDRWTTSPDPKGYIGTGWNVKHVFSGGDGILYTVDNDGHLHWFRHDGYLDGTARWTTSPEPKGYIGTGWDLPWVLGAGRGVIYTVDAKGFLHWLRHDGWQTGAAAWTYSPDSKGYIGEGWLAQQVFAAGLIPRNVGVRMEFQQTNLWCWIAVATSINHCYDGGSHATQSGTMTAVGHQVNQFPMSTSAYPDAQAYVDQPTLASLLAAPTLPAAYEVLNGPAVKLDARYVKSGGVGDALKIYANWANNTNLPSISLQQITSELQAGRPIAMDIRWMQGGGQHCVAVAGVLDDLLLICDPATGESLIRYADFPQAYQGGASLVAACMTVAGPPAQP